MKWLTASFLCLLANSAALAEEPIPKDLDVMNLAIGVQCRPDSPSRMLKEQFGEIPMLDGEAIVLGSAQTILPGDMKMYVNPENKTYTIAFSVNNELFCVVMTGMNLGPAMQGNEL